MKYHWIDSYCLEKSGAKKDFKEEWGWYRYLIGGKMFGAMCSFKDGRTIFTLKCEPSFGAMLRENYDDITPGYYMNKEHWNSVYLDGNVPDDVIKDMIDMSYKLVFTSLTKKLQKEINNSYEGLKNTARVYFQRFLSQADFKYYELLAFNEKVMVMNFGRVFSLEEAKISYNYMLETNKKNDTFGYLKIFHKDTKNFMGLCGFIFNDDFTEAEMEYMFLPEYWGNGYGKEVVKCLLNKADEIKSLKSIKAFTDPNNEVSRKILLNSGFVSQKIFTTEDGNLAETFIR